MNGQMFVEVISDKGDVSSYDITVTEGPEDTLCFQMPVAIPLGYTFRLHAPKIERPPEPPVVVPKPPVAAVVAEKPTPPATGGK